MVVRFRSTKTMNPSITNKFIENWLRSEDKNSFNERRIRLRWLIDEFGSFDNIIAHYGGFISYRAFEEARRCYLYGEFIAVVLLSQIVLEHTLAGLFQMEGRDDLNCAGFKKLLDEAIRLGYTSQQEYDVFNTIRKLRNPYVHYRSPMNSEHIGQRIVMNDMTPFEIFETDAQVALKVVFRLLNRLSP